MSLRQKLAAQYETAGDPLVRPEKALGDLLALMRAQYLSYQTSHWQVVGDGFYGNHQLFQRLYEGVQAEVDVLAEKMVGYFGRESVSVMTSTARMLPWVDKWSHIHCHHKRGLQSEQDFQMLVKLIHEALQGRMSLGLDDWLMGTASDHETHTYLLQQALARPHDHSKTAASDKMKVKRKDTGKVVEVSKETLKSEKGGDYEKVDDGAKDKGDSKTQALTNKLVKSYSSADEYDNSDLSQEGGGYAQRMDSIREGEKDPDYKPHSDDQKDKEEVLAGLKRLGLPSSMTSKQFKELDDAIFKALKGKDKDKDKGKKDTDKGKSGPSMKSKLVPSSDLLYAEDVEGQIDNDLDYPDKGAGKEKKDRQSTKIDKGLSDLAKTFTKPEHLERPLGQIRQALKEGLGDKSLGALVDKISDKNLISYLGSHITSTQEGEKIWDGAQGKTAKGPAPKGEHRPGDVWQTDSGRWRALDPKGKPWSFEKKDDATLYAKGERPDKGKDKDKGEGNKGNAAKAFSEVASTLKENKAEVEKALNSPKAKKALGDWERLAEAEATETPSAKAMAAASEAVAGAVTGTLAGLAFGSLATGGALSPVGALVGAVAGSLLFGASADSSIRQKELEKSEPPKKPEEPKNLDKKEMEKFEGENLSDSDLGGILNSAASGMFDKAQKDVARYMLDTRKYERKLKDHEEWKARGKKAADLKKKLLDALTNPTAEMKSLAERIINDKGGVDKAKLEKELTKKLDKKAARDRLAALYVTADNPGDSGAGSEEGRFFDNPEKREVREFAQTDAVTNAPDVAAEAASEDNLDVPKAKAVSEAKKAPPTPTEIVEEPGGEAVSTLNRYIVETEEKVPKAVPQSHEEVPKHPVLTADWSHWNTVK